MQLDEVFCSPACRRVDKPSGRAEEREKQQAAVWCRTPCTSEACPDHVLRRNVSISTAIDQRTTLVITADGDTNQPAEPPAEPAAKRQRLAVAIALTVALPALVVLALIKRALSAVVTRAPALA